MEGNPKRGRKPKAREPERKVGRPSKLPSPEGLPAFIDMIKLNYNIKTDIGALIHVIEATAGLPHWKAEAKAREYQNLLSKQRAKERKALIDH